MANIIPFMHSLLCQKVEHIYCVSEEIQGGDEMGSNIHPMVTFLSTTVDLQEFIQTHLLGEQKRTFFGYRRRK